jgi:5-methylcytosine-specific restriction enzyme subunit McrC
MASPAMSAGASPAPGLLFDMNKLFEAHVARLEEASAGTDRIVHMQGPPLHLAARGSVDVFLLKPDITVWHIGQHGAASRIDRVVDAKWKRLNPHVPDFGVDEADVYQLLAYAVRYGCTDLELAYPMPEGSNAHTVTPRFELTAADFGLTGKITITVKLIPLWKQETLSHAMQDRLDQEVIQVEAEAI